MKKLLQKIFFWETPVQGLFFCMTLLMALPWIYFTLLCAALFNPPLTEKLVNHKIFGVVTILILSWLPIVTMFNYGLLLGKTHNSQSSILKRVLRWCLVCLCFLLPLPIFFNIYDFASFALAILLMLIGIAMLFPCRSKFERMAITLLWPLGFVGLCLILAYGALPFYSVIDKLSDGPLPIVKYHDYIWLTSIRESLRISGAGWKWLAIASFFCIAAGYFVQARALSRFWKISLRKLLSIRSICVLSFCLIVYLVSLPFALHEEAKYKRNFHDIDYRYNNATAIGKQISPYFNDDAINEPLWKRLELASEKVDFPHDWQLNFYMGTFAEITPLASEWEADLFEKWKNRYLSQKELETINNCLDNEMAIAPPEYRDTALCALGGFDPSDIRILLICFKSQLWQLRFAIENKDAETAICIFTRMNNICSYLYNNHLYAYQECLKLYVHAMCCFIESGLADARWLDLQMELFAQKEFENLSLEKREYVREMKRFCTLCDGIVHRLGETQANGAELSQLRFFFPQAWWLTSAKANEILNDIHGWDTSELASPTKFPNAIADRIIYKAKDRICKVNVMTSCAKVLLEAEKIRRKTGEYPKEIASPPLDPFTQKPLQYEIGTFEYKSQYVYNAVSDDDDNDISSDDDCDCEEYVNPTWHPTTSSAPMLRVFSPGMDKSSSYDDICFFIMLN